MNIVLIANTEKNELLSQFCVNQSGVLSQQNLYATATTGKWVENATGMHVNRLLSTEQGGYQQVAAYVAYGEVDMVIFFRDPQDLDEISRDENYLLCTCDKCGVPVATNIATAELLIRAVQKDASGWRSILGNIHK